MVKGCDKLIGYVNYKIKLMYKVNQALQKYEAKNEQLVKELN